MPVFIRQQLSESNKGVPMRITGATELIHQVQATATTDFELITLFINNTVSSGAESVLFEVTNGATSALLRTAAEALSGQTKEPKLVFSQLHLSGTDSAVHLLGSASQDYSVWGHVDRVATG